MANIQNYQCFANPGSEPDQELTYSYIDYLEYWEVDEIDCGYLGLLNGDGIYSDWMGEPFEDRGTTRLSGMNTEWVATPGASTEALLLLGDSEQGISPQTNISHTSDQFDWVRRSSSSDSQSSNILFSPSSYQSPPKEPEVPDVQPPSSSLFKNTSYCCTICKPHRSFPTSQGLK